MNEFRCEKCGSGNLAYEKFVCCKTPIEIQGDGTFVYLESIIDEDNSIPACYGFCCADCGQAIYFKGYHVQSEAELKEILSLPEQERNKVEDEYWATEMIFSACSEEDDEHDHFLHKKKEFKTI